ncbi:MAG: hypothetical protein KC421_13435, partial [Anaerolineales bacterium]|nr:hypothetical protein [Anaerolineales bacterium]
GFKCLYVPDAIVQHDYALRFGPQKTYYQERNRYLMLLKNLRWRTLLLLLPSLLLAEALTWGFVLLQEPRRYANKIRAYGWILQNWQPLMAKRRQTQAIRRITDGEWLKNVTARLSFEQVNSGVLAHIAHWLFDPFFTLWLWALQGVVFW